jgi:hypothetical protein
LLKKDTNRGSAQERVLELGVELVSFARLLDGRPAVESRLEPAALDDVEAAAQAVGAAQGEVHVGVLRVLLEPLLGTLDGGLDVVLEALLALGIDELGPVDVLGPGYDRLAVVAVGVLGLGGLGLGEARLGAGEIHRVDGADAVDDRAVDLRRDGGVRGAQGQREQQGTQHGRHLTNQGSATSLQSSW